MLFITSSYANALLHLGHAAVFGTISSPVDVDAVPLDPNHQPALSTSKCTGLEHPTTAHDNFQCSLGTVYYMSTACISTSSHIILHTATVSMDIPDRNLHGHLPDRV
jgi:hypothetical protein